MAYCRNCGTFNQDGSAYCSACGTKLSQNPDNAFVNTNAKDGLSEVRSFGNRPERYPVGGLMAWSIVTLLLCTIPGIVALVYTTRINNSVSQEEQEKNIADAKKWCLIGTILGVVVFLLGFIIGMAG